MKISIVNGHCIADNDGTKCLIDTGSPFSLAKNGTLSFCGQEYSLPSSKSGANLQEVSKRVGFQLDALIGNNLLNKFVVCFDYSKQEIDFKTQNDMTHDEYISADIDFRESVPVLQVQLNGNMTKIKMLLDSGAKVSYINGAFTRNLPKFKESVEDFYPGSDTFITPIYQINTKICDKELNVQYGNLPSELQVVVDNYDADGIIGYDLFNSFVVVIDYPAKKIFLK